MELLSIVGFLLTVLALNDKLIKKMNERIHKLNTYLLGSSHSLFILANHMTEDLWTTFKEHSEEMTGVSTYPATTNLRDRILVMAGKTPSYGEGNLHNDDNHIGFFLIPYLIKNKDVGLIPRLLACMLASFISAFRFSVYVFTFAFVIVLGAVIADEVLGISAGWAKPFTQFVGGFIFMTFFLSLLFLTLCIFFWFFALFTYVIEKILNVICYKDGWPMVILGIVISAPSAVAVFLNSA